MNLTERMLLRLSRSVDAPDIPGEGFARGLDGALTLLLAAFPDLVSRIAGRSVLDFGCGFGYQAVAMCLEGARRVVGTDIRQQAIEHGRSVAAGAGVADRVTFAERITSEDEGQFDVVISLNSMEHFTDPQVALDLMVSALKPGGSLLLTFSPPWYAPYGGHMHFFTRVPWVHLLFSERTVMAVRGRFRQDGATRYEDVEGGLNRMSRRRFERLIRSTPLTARWTRNDAVKGLPIVASLPVLRELLTNRISVVLEKPAPATSAPR